MTVPTNAANPDLEAETSLNLELGYRWESDRARFGISVFRDRYDDFIESVRLTANPGVEYETCSRGTCTTTRRSTSSAAPGRAGAPRSSS